MKRVFLIITSWWTMFSNSSSSRSVSSFLSRSTRVKVHSSTFSRKFLSSLSSSSLSPTAELCLKKCFYMKKNEIHQILIWYWRAICKMIRDLPNGHFALLRLSCFIKRPIRGHIAKWMWNLESSGQVTY